MKIFGIIATLLWLVVFAVLAEQFSKYDMRSFFDLTLNERGDFLAGLFAPVAFLWLVLGYLQQSEELKLQRIEISRLAEAQENQTKSVQDNTNFAAVQNFFILEKKLEIGLRDELYEIMNKNGFKSLNNSIKASDSISVLCGIFLSPDCEHQSILNGKEHIEQYIKIYDILIQKAKDIAVRTNDDSFLQYYQLSPMAEVYNYFKLISDENINA